MNWQAEMLSEWQAEMLSEWQARETERLRELFRQLYDSEGPYSIQEMFEAYKAGYDQYWRGG